MLLNQYEKTTEEIIKDALDTFSNDMQDFDKRSATVVSKGFPKSLISTPIFIDGENYLLGAILAAKITDEVLIIDDAKHFNLTRYTFSKGITNLTLAFTVENNFEDKQKVDNYITAGRLAYPDVFSNIKIVYLYEVIEKTYNKKGKENIKKYYIFRNEKGEIIDMSKKFNLTIMNPPYGKCGRTATTILKYIKNNIKTDTIISLNQPVSFEGVAEHMIGYTELTHEESVAMFDGEIGVDSLAIGVIDPTIMLLKEEQFECRHKTATEDNAIYWLEKYNGPDFKDNYVVSHINKSPTVKNKENVAAGKYFLYGVWDMKATNINKSNTSLIVTLNYDKKDLVWAGEINDSGETEKNGNDVYGLYLNSKLGRDNYRDAFFEDTEYNIFAFLREDSVNIKQKRKNMYDMLIMLKGNYNWETISHHPLWESNKNLAICEVLSADPNGAKVVELYNNWRTKQ